MPDRLHFTGNDEADALLAEEPMALLVGFALDQQVTVPTAFAGPLKLKQRIGTLDAGRVWKTGRPAAAEPADGAPRRRRERKPPPRRARGGVPGEAGNPPLPREHGEARAGA